MEYKLAQWTASNYEITLSVTAEDLAAHKNKALQSFQKEMKEPGFRDGHVPLDIVEKKVQPQYLEVAIYEEVIHAGTKVMLDENKEIKFIGNVYDLNKEEKDGNTIFTFKLDVYPEVTEKDDKWNALSISAIDSKPTEQEINETLDNLRKQYASYDETDTVAQDSVFKVTFKLLDVDGNEVDNGSAFMWKEEFEEFPAIVETFVGKKNSETFKASYTEDGTPPILHNRKKDTVADTVEYTIGDVRTVTYPDFTPENIKKFFGNEEVKTKEELIEKVSGLIETQKEEALLMQAVDGMLGDASDSLEVIIPKTLIDEEMKTRMKSLEERMGGADGLKSYFEQLGEEEKNKMLADIKTAATSSLEKFFMLRRLTELFDIQDINWQEAMNVEKKLYEKLKK